MSWYAGFEPICRPDCPLAEYTWYRLGGPARWLFEPRDDAELAGLVAACRGAGVPWRVLGRGANVLVRDAGFDGAVLRLDAPFFQRVIYENSQVTAGAGVDFPKLVKETLQRGLVGLEALAGIPGTMGGVTRMNAGGRYGEIGRFVRRVRVLEADGALNDRSAETLGLGYRRTALEGCIVIATTLELGPGDREAALARHKHIWNEKYDSQPPVSARSAGCIFKNPPGHAAGRLIDQAGLKGTRAGQAEISARHANFIVAHDGATAADVIGLIELARQRVREQFGVALETEVEIW